MYTIKDILSKKGISEDTFKAFTAEEVAGVYNEMNQLNKEEFASFKGSVEEKAKMQEELIAKHNEQFDSLNSILKEQGVALRKLEAGEESSISEKSLDAMLAEKSEELSKLKHSSSAMNNVKFTIKAAGDMSFGSNVTGQVPQAFRTAGFNDIAQRETRVLDLPVKANVTSNLIEWVYVANEDGTAGPTGEGLLKNQIDFDLLVGSEKVQKVTAFITITDELLDDPAQMASQVNNKLVAKVMQAVEDQYLKGDGTGTNLNGVKTVASAFTPGSFATGQPNAVESPNVVDVITVAKAQIAVANQGMPNAIIMHPEDVAAMKTVKVTSTDRRYVERVLASGQTLSIDGTPVVVSNAIDKGEYVVGNFQLSTLYTKDSLEVEVGYNADNFVKNFKTIRAEWRGAGVIETNDRTAFVAGTIATDIAAISKV
jgi:HK97 family phage major capsid protein